MGSKKHFSVLETVVSIVIEVVVVGKVKEDNVETSSEDDEHFDSKLSLLKALSEVDSVHSELIV